MLELLRINEDDLYDEDDYCPYWNGKKFTGIGYYTGADGVIYEENSYKNGSPHGLYQRFYYDGSLEEKGYFKNGYAYGLWKKWDESGNLRKVSIHSSRSINYTHEWDELGNLIYKKQCTKLGTLLNEYWREQYFFKNGSLSEEKIYAYHILEHSKSWDEEGNLLQKYQITVEDPNYKSWLEYSKKYKSTNPFTFSK
jgi:antitoxin component YwqK of YwqJK toxin-antitoxin module